MGDESHTVFSDESGLSERFVSYGAVLLPTSLVEPAEAILDQFCEENGFGDRSLSWKSCSKGELERYRFFADAFWDAPELEQADFRAMVVDTRKYPLQHPASGANTREQGFYRFYHWFLVGSIKNVLAEGTRFELIIAPRSDQYPFNKEILESTLAGALRRDLPDSFESSAIAISNPKLSRIHQLADLLLGAVSYQFNRRTRDPKGKSHKKILHDHVRHRVDRDLDQDFLPNDRPFNVWGWTPKGSKRWVRGARGRA